MKKHLTFPNHPSHARAIGALTEAVESCHELTEDHGQRCRDDDCACCVARGIVTALEMFLAFLEGAPSAPRPERRCRPGLDASRRAVCCATR